MKDSEEEVERKLQEFSFWLSCQHFKLVLLSLSIRLKFDTTPSLN